jgi:hypothetical protein
VDPSGLNLSICRLEFVTSSGVEYVFRFPFDVSEDVVFVKKERLSEGLNVVDLYSESGAGDES